MVSYARNAFFDEELMPNFEALKQNQSHRQIFSDFYILTVAGFFLPMEKVTKETL